MTLSSTTIWTYNRRVTHRLAGWSAASIIAWLVTIGSKGPFWRAFGVQCATWGAVDAVIALGGQQAAERRQAAATVQTDMAHARQLRRLLWFNAALDVLYVAGGIALLRSRRGDRARHGHGAGIILQGAFLLIFDMLHALRVPRITPQ